LRGKEIKLYESRVPVKKKSEADREIKSSCRHHRRLQTFRGFIDRDLAGTEISEKRHPMSSRLAGLLIKASEDNGPLSCMKSLILQIEDPQIWLFLKRQLVYLDRALAKKLKERHKNKTG